MPDRVTRAHTPAFLQGVSLGFRNRDMIADRVAPRIPVAKQSDRYRIWGKNNLLLHRAEWAAGSIPNAIETRWSDDTYFAELRKLRTLLLDAERRNADADLNLQLRYTEIVTNAIILAREKRVADLFITAANYSAGNVITKGGGAEWNTLPGTGGENPITDLLTIIGKVSDAAMVPMSALSVVIPEIVWRVALMRNAAVLNSVANSTVKVASTDLLAQMLGVKEVILSTSISVGAGPEVAGADIVTGFTSAYLWGDTVWVGLINDGTNDMAPSFARSFNWRDETNGQDRVIRQYRTEDEGREADWLECKEAIGEKIIFKDAGGIIVNTLSTI